MSTLPRVAPVAALAARRAFAWRGRAVRLATVVFLVTLLCASLVSLLPGDPVEVMVPVGIEGQRAEIREDLGLDRSVPERYVAWLADFVGGDEDGWPGLGKYYTVSSDRPVIEPVREALPVSLQLMVYAQVLALALAVPLGVLTAARAGRAVDRAAGGVAFGLLSIPNFAIALLLAYYVGVQRRWLPSGGYVPPGEDLVEHARTMVLPALSLGLGQVALYMRLLRSDMVQTLREDFITTAEAKGVPERRVLWRHALRPSSLTLLTVAGLNVGALVGGAVVIEVLFSLPGIGQLIAQAIAERQFVALQSLVAIVAIGYVVVNAVVDLLYGALDPRIRHAGGGR